MWFSRTESKLILMRNKFEQTTQSHALRFFTCSPATYERAQREDVRLVSVTWLNACAKERVRMPESDYPPVLSRKWRQLAESPFRSRLARGVNLHVSSRNLELLVAHLVD